MAKNKFVCNIYEVGNRDIDKGEFNTLPSLVDKMENVPTLEEYLKNYCLGAPLPIVDNGEEYADDDEEFKPQDFRNVDVEDLKEYNRQAFAALAEINEYKLKKKKEVVEEKKLVEEKKEEKELTNKKE